MTRVLSAAVLLPVLVGVVWFLPPLATLILAELVLLAAFMEYADLADRLGVSFPRTLSAAAVLGTCAVFGLAPSMVLVMIMAGTVGIAVVQLSHWPHLRSLSSASAATFAMLYLAVPLGSMASLRATHGRETLLLLLGVVMASDTAQYYGGRLLGRRPLAPRISPKKTVEGAVFGLGAGMLVMWGGGHWWLSDVAAGWRVLLGATLACLGIAGDLFESTIKRGASVKDASQIIPGHGGVLDRLDALLFAAPIYYTVVLLAR